MRTHLKRKEIDDVLGGKDSWANVDVVDGESMPASAGPHSLNRILRSGGSKLEPEKEEEREEEEDIEKEADPSYLPCMR